MHVNLIGTIGAVKQTEILQEVVPWKWPSLESGGLTPLLVS